MTLHFQKREKGDSYPDKTHTRAYLTSNNWDDYSFKSLFYLTVIDENGVKHDIGDVKIGYRGQEEGYTKEKIPDLFESLSEIFFSLGQDAGYYQNIKETLSAEIAEDLLHGLRDVAHEESILKVAEGEQIFKISLLRTVSLSAIKGQYKRILEGGVQLTEFHFGYEKIQNEFYSGIELDFHVEPNSKPSTNVHVLIGRNGVGKTTLLNSMVKAIVDVNSTDKEVGRFFNKENNPFAQSKFEDYFSSVVSVSFSAFDPFVPPPDQINRSLGTCYFYVGLKSIFGDGDDRKAKLKDYDELGNDFVESLKTCLSQENKKERWLSAIVKLESDMNFEEMDLQRLAHIPDPNAQSLEVKAKSIFSRMSSGHAVVLLSITKLVEVVEEKTLVLMDEPESHLHPPLLSAFTRALSDLLINRNGVAIIATHSPVVLQEVPKTCVWKLRRNRLVGHVDRPENETFGENVGILTREVFGLEVSKSGFHALLLNSVAEGKSYEYIINDFGNQLGFEGKAILRALIAERDDH